MYIGYYLSVGEANVYWVLSVLGGGKCKKPLQLVSQQAPSNSLTHTLPGDEYLVFIPMGQRQPRDWWHSYVILLQGFRPHILLLGITVRAPMTPAGCEEPGLAITAMNWADFQGNTDDRSHGQGRPYLARVATTLCERCYPCVNLSSSPSGRVFHQHLQQTQFSQFNLKSGRSLDCVVQDIKYR